MGTTGTLSPHSLLMLVRELDARGLDPGPALAESGLSRERLERLDLAVPAVQGLRLARHALALAEDPALGVAAGLRITPEDLGLAGLLLRSSPDVSTALAIFSQLQLSSAPYFSGGIAFSRDGLDVHYEPELGGGTPRVLHDAFLVAAMTISAHVLGPFRPDALDLAVPEPADLEPYRRLLPVLPQFDRPRTRLAIPAAATRTVLPHHDSLVHRLLAPHVIEDRAATVPADLVGRVRALLLADPEGTIPTIAQVADRLAMSPRHLRRQLQRQGTGYLTLLDEAKHELALQFLAERPSSTGAELAARLGYADPPAFYRAFKRWTGLTVTDYRDRLLDVRQS